MKIKWQFNDGTKSELEVTDEIGTVILDSRRKEHALAERERYPSTTGEEKDRLCDYSRRYQKS